MAADLKQCAEYGQQHGVLVGIQNHADFLQTADEVLKLLKLVDSDWFGVVVDTGSFQTGDPYGEIAQVVPYAVNFQIKESPLGASNPLRMDLKKLLQIIRAGGYRGYLPIETLVATGTPYEPRVLLPQMLLKVRLAIEQTG
jgi:sugar phosphate isomerase/epimerase